MSTAAKKPDASRPFGPWADFQDCMDDCMSKSGYDEDTAKKVCGALKAKLEEASAAKTRDGVRPGEHHLYASGNLGQVDTTSRTVPILASTPNPVEGEALVGWDLSRFANNPVVLWAHDATKLPIGKASDVEFDPAVGLRMNVRFARAEANPLAEQVYQSAIDGIVRAVSVGYDLGPVTEVVEDVQVVKDGAVVTTKRARKVRQAKLLEVSFVPIGLDPDAGTPALNPEAEEPEPDEDELGDEEVRAQVSKAAASMARWRARQRRQLRTDDVGPGVRPGEHQPADAAPGVRPGEHQPADAAPGVRPGEQNSCGCGCGVADRARMDRAEVGHELRMDRGPVNIGRAENTPSGGKRLPARLARIGVLEYRQPDGSVRRELRLPEEVFKADSLRTLEDAPVIDVVHHTGMIGPETWRQSAIGHVRDVRRDGDYVVGTLAVQHTDALDAIARGDRVEISCGYVCRLDLESGVWQGEKYDCIQRDIRYNHAAICPPNGGRSGPEVGIRLDHRASAWAVAQIQEDEEMAIKIRLDGRDYEVGTQEHLDAVDRIHKAEVVRLEADAKARLDAVVAERSDLKTRLDKAEGERDALKTTVDQLRTDAAAEKAKADSGSEERKERERAALRGKLRLVTAVARFFGSKDDDEDEDDDGPPSSESPGKPAKKKSRRLDAVDKLLDMSDRDLMLKVIQKSVPDFKDVGSDGKPRTDDYLRARFDTIVEQDDDRRSVGGVVRVAEAHRHRLDAADEAQVDNGGGRSPVAAARASRDKAFDNAWKVGRQ